MNLNPTETSWQNDLAGSLRTTQDLVDFGLISPEKAPETEAVMAKYRFLLPVYYAKLIDKADPQCPIRLQALPAPEEHRPFGLGDPLGDFKHRPVERITHRYRNRALLHLTPNCSMYCRFCFRKTLLNEESDHFFEGGLAPAFEYLREHSEIEEVILSGGDPFMVSDANLTWTMKQLGAIRSLKRVRFHTRVPVTFPQRVTPELVEAITLEKPVIVVTHFNHAREITREARAAVTRLKAGGMRLLNQSVLLRGVNDSSHLLADLCERLFDCGVQPYYLHHPDGAAGTASFQLTREEGRKIYLSLRRQLSGYLVPKYVVDEGDADFKVDV